MPGAEGNWIIMGFEEFERFLETEEGRRRKDCFERLDAASEDDDILYMECESKAASRIKQERNHSDYLRDKEEKSGYRMFSLDAPIDPGDGEAATLLDIIADETKDTERTAVREILRKELPAALSLLDPREKEIIRALYFSDENTTMRSYARQHGVCRVTVNRWHRYALDKMRLYYREKKLL